MILPDMDEETEIAGQSILPNNIEEVMAYYNKIKSSVSLKI